MGKESGRENVNFVQRLKGRTYGIQYRKQHKQGADENQKEQHHRARGGTVGASDASTEC